MKSKVVTRIIEEMKGMLHRSALSIVRARAEGKSALLSDEDRTRLEQSIERILQEEVELWM